MRAADSLRSTLQLVEAVDPVKGFLGAGGYRDNDEAWFEDVDDRIGKRRKGNMANAWRYSLEQPGTAKSRMCGDEIKNPLDLFEEAVAQARNATLIPIARFREFEARGL